MSPSSWRALFRRIATGELRPHRRRIALALIAAIFAGLSTATQAWLVQPALDRVFLDRDPFMLAAVPLAIVLAVIVKAAAGYIEEMQLARVGLDVIADLQKRLFDRLVHDELAWLRDRGTGALLSHLTYDVTLLRQTVSNVFTGFIRDGLTLLCLIGLMLYQDVLLACIAAIAFPVAVLPLLRMGRRVRQLTLGAQEQMGRLTARLEQGFEAIRQVKADGQEDRESGIVAGMIDRFRDVQFAAARFRALASPSVELVTGFMIGLIILYGGWQVLGGKTTPGTFFSFLTAMLMAYQPMKRIAKLNTMLHEGLSAAGRIYALIDRPRTMHLPAHPAILRNPVQGTIRFRGVTFAHGTRTVFRDFDLAITAGEHWAITGPSGCGKSTLLDLVLRLHDVQAGEVMLDGVDVRGIAPADLRRSVALVAQESWFFDDTIAANIAYGRPDATFAEIRHAARLAMIDDVIGHLERGYDTRLGAGGIHLSGGQLQRLSIARAILLDRPVMLLDEATSALDAETERQVLGNIRNHRHSRTTIYVSHRESINSITDHKLQLKY